MIHNSDQGLKQRSRYNTKNKDQGINQNQDKHIRYKSKNQG